MAEYRINLEVDPTGARRASREVEQSLDRVSSRADRTRRLVSRAFAVIATAIGGREIIARIAGFEQAMSTVRAITGATERDFDRLQATARELGTNTRFSATQAAEGMQFLARAGFDTNEVLGAIEGTLQLAQAGALDLGQAADIASNVLTGFRLNTEDTGRVVDVLAYTANNANTNVYQLGDAMRYVAPVAAGLGIDIEEAAAAVGALSDAGLQGSLAGTGLRRVLSELASPANRTRRILEGLGLTAEDVAVQQVGLTEAIRRLGEAGIDTGLALELFGDRGGPAFEVLRNAVPEIAAFTEELQGAGGTAAEMAAIMDDNLNGALLAVRSAWEGLILAFSDLGPGNALTILMQALAGALRFVAENIETVTRLLVAFGIVLAVPRITAAVSALQALASAFVASATGASTAASATATQATTATASAAATTAATAATTASVSANTAAGASLGGVAAGYAQAATGARAAATAGTAYNATAAAAPGVIIPASTALATVAAGYGRVATAANAAAASARVSSVGIVQYSSAYAAFQGVLNSTARTFDGVVVSTTAAAASTSRFATAVQVARAAVVQLTAALAPLLRTLGLFIAIEAIFELIEFANRLRGVSAEADNVTRQLEAFDAQMNASAQATQAVNDAIATSTQALQALDQATEGASESQGEQSEILRNLEAAQRSLLQVERARVGSQNALAGASDRYIAALRELTRGEESSAEAKLNLRAQQIALTVALRTGQITLREYRMGMREVREGYRELALGTQEAARAQSALVQGLDTVTAAAGRAEVAANRATSAIERLGSAASRGRIRGAAGATGSFDISDPDALRQALEAWLAGIPFASLNTGTSYVNGPAGIDRVPAMLTRGEAVITASANARHPGLADRLNRGQQIRYYNTGTDYVSRYSTAGQTSSGYGASFRAAERRSMDDGPRTEEINNNQTVIINVTTPDADSFLRSREQIRRQEWNALRRASQRAN